MPWMLPKSVIRNYFLFLSWNKEHFSFVWDLSWTGTVTISLQSETWSEKQTNKQKKKLATDPSDLLCVKKLDSLTCLILGSRLWHKRTRRERFSFSLLLPWPYFGQVLRPLCSFPNSIKSPGGRKLKLKTLVGFQFFLEAQQNHCCL